MSSPLPEYLRVRAYLYNLIQKADADNLQIPPENELCRMFQVSRNTVRGAIKGLVKTKHLMPRRGMGTYINPDMIGRHSVKAPIIGVVAGDGLRVFDSCPWHVMQAIQESGMHMQPIFLTNSESSQRLMEIVQTHVDGLLWVDCSNPEYYEALGKCEVPVLLISDCEDVDNIDCIMSSSRQRGMAIANYMKSKGHRDLLFIHKDCADCAFNPYISADSTYGGYKTRRAELFGLYEGGDILPLSEFMRLNELGCMPGHYTAVYGDLDVLRIVLPVLEKSGRKIPDDISCLVYERPAPFFFGTLQPSFLDVKTPSQEMLYSWLKLRIVDGDRGGVFRKTVSARIFDGDTVRQT